MDGKFHKFNERYFMNKNLKQSLIIFNCLFFSNLFASQADGGEVTSQANGNERNMAHNVSNKFYTIESRNFEDNVVQQLQLLLGTERLPYHVATPHEHQKPRPKDIYISSVLALKLLGKVENCPISQTDSGLLTSNPESFFHRLFAATQTLGIDYIEGHCLAATDNSGTTLLGMRLDSMSDLIHRINARNEIAKLKSRLTESEMSRNQNA